MQITLNLHYLVLGVTTHHRAPVRVRKLKSVIMDIEVKEIDIEDEQFKGLYSLECKPPATLHIPEEWKGIGVDIMVAQEDAPISGTLTERGWVVEGQFLIFDDEELIGNFEREHQTRAADFAAGYKMSKERYSSNDE